MRGLALNTGAIAEARFSTVERDGSRFYWARTVASSSARIIAWVSSFFGSLLIAPCLLLLRMRASRLLEQNQLVAVSVDGSLCQRPERSEITPTLPPAVPAIMLETFHVRRASVADHRCRCALHTGWHRARLPQSDEAAGGSAKPAEICSAAALLATMWVRS
jgi:hypothetical protein